MSHNVRHESGIRVSLTDAARIAHRLDPEQRVEQAFRPAEPDINFGVFAPEVLPAGGMYLNA
jgi:hypothetical protein